MGFIGGMNFKAIHGKEIFKKCVSIFNDRYTLISLIIAMIFAIIYSYISIMRYLALTQNVLDLGVSSNLLYSVTHGGLFPTALNPRPLVPAKLIYIPMGFIYSLYPHEWSLLIYQDFFLSLSPIALYFIGRELGFGKRMSLGFEVLYFLYYPLSGVYWFDFHFMAFFPTPFLFGILMYLRSNRNWIPLLFIASITDYMAPVLVGWFLMIEMVKSFRKTGMKSRLFNEIIMYILMVILFLVPTLYGGRPYYSNYMSVQNSSGLYLTDTLKYDFILRVLLPVLFIPLVAFEYLSMLIPYCLFIIFNNYAPYQNLMFFQYGALYTPVVMFSLLVGLSRIMGKLEMKWGAKKSKISIKGIVCAVIVVNMVMFTLYTPIGASYNGHLAKEYVNPSLTGSAQYYEFFQKITPQPYDAAIMKMMDKIPKGSSVFVQGNLPELCQGYNASVTIQSLSHPPEYFVDDPYNYQFYNIIPYPVAGFKNISFLQATNILLNTNNYGLVDSYQGASLYELGYSGTASSFTPLDYNFSTQNPNSNVEIQFLAPGNYNVSISNSTGGNLSLIIGNSTLHPVGQLNGTYFFTYTTAFYESNVRMSIQGSGHSTILINLVQGEL